MKHLHLKTVAGFFLVFLLITGSISPIYAKSSATIIFSGEMRGNIEPCAL